MKHEQSESRDRIWSIVREFSEACVRGGGFERLASAVDDSVVFIPPGFGGRIEGRDRLLGMYAAACSGMKIHEMRESEEQIDVFGDTAVVSYRYDTVWEAHGRRNTQNGREILVFSRRDGDWRLCWRAIQPVHRETQPSASDAGSASGGDQPAGGLQDECLALMAKARACFLSTLDAQGFPETTGMDNLRNPELYPSLAPLFAEHRDDFLVYLSTRMDSNKIQRVEGNRRSSLYYYDPEGAVGLMLVGSVEVVRDRAVKDRFWQKDWVIHYPSGPEGPEYALLSFTPHLARGWGNNGAYEFTLPLSAKDVI